jgi:hypothetical protein
VPPPRNRLSHALVTLIIASTGGASAACGGIATDFIASDGGGDSTPSPHAHVAADAGPDANVERDAAVSTDAEVDEDALANVEVEAGQCDEGLNTTYPPSECGGPSTYWLASPYRPARDITVHRIEIHTMGGSVALLANGASGPGALLFTGKVPTSDAPEWLPTSVTPPVSLKGGELYYLAFEGSYCSQAQGGPNATEYGSGTLEGPWTVTGTDNWTARVIGTCP